MPSYEAPRCRHIKVNGTQCGSPAVRNQKFCFYHHGERPWPVECYSDGEYATGDIILPYFEDAHSIQSVVRRVMQMLLQKRIDRKTASLLLYALQIASSNLKRVELEKPQPEQVVTDFETESKVPIAAAVAYEAASENAAIKNSDDTAPKDPCSNENLLPGTIQACEERELTCPSGLMRQTRSRRRQSRLSNLGTVYAKRRPEKLMVARRILS